MRRLAVLVTALVVVAPTGATTASSHLRVTVGQDGARGSLRQLIEDVAKPGDTIVFPTALRVELRRKLTIPRKLASLTIDGSTATGGVAEIVGVPSAGGTFIEVLADGFTARRLKLTSLPLVLGARTADDGSQQGAGRARVLDVETSGSTRGHSGLDFSFARGFLVRGGRIANGIELTGTEGGRITEVTLAAKGSSVNDEESERLEIVDNKLESGRLVLRSESVVVLDNKVAGGATIDVLITGGGHGRVAGNTIAGGRILAQAIGSIEVVDNEVTGAGGGLPGIGIGCAAQATRPKLVARGNDVRGRRIGILAQCDRTLPISLVNNAVEGNGTGIVVDARSATISGGRVRGNKGAGIRVRRGSQTTIRKVIFGGNAGLAIDRADSEARKPGLRYDAKKQRIRGTACVGCAVDLYAAEEGREAGEGIRILGTVRAGGDGRFEYPRGGTLRCPTPMPVAAIATDEKRKVTSEFAGDAVCETPGPPDCRARFTPIGYTPGTAGAIGARIEISCGGVDVKSSSIGGGSGGRIATFSSKAKCEKVDVSGSGPDRALRCVYPTPNRRRIVGFEYTREERFASTTLFVSSGGLGEGGTEHVLVQHFILHPDGVICSQTVPRAATTACSTL